jgi:nucleoside 2-deoxyribosyltransferase
MARERKLSKTKEKMRQLKKKQLLLVEEVDRGLTIEEIAAALGKSASTVNRQLARVRRRVKDGNFSPDPLPIEREAKAPGIYLAGFDVFRPDAAAHGDYLKALCRQHGFSGIYPLDSNVPLSLTPNERAKWIFTANTEAILGADVVMANLNDFRGSGEPDSGTAFEVGFAAALKKPIWGYRSAASDLIDHVPSEGHPLGRICARGFLVEDFGMSVNLMLACGSTIIVGGPAECLAAIKVSRSFA